MSIKDKIAIGLIVLLVILFGFSLIGDAADVTAIPDLDKEAGVTINDMATLAERWILNNDSRFVDIPASQLYNHTITGNKGGAAVWHRSGMCMYHYQSNSVDSQYHIYSVIDFDLNFWGTEAQVKNNGTTVNNAGSYAWALAEALTTAYKNSKYDTSVADGSNQYKNVAKNTFYVAKNKGELGRITNDYLGGSGISTGSSSASNLTSNNLKDNAQIANYKKISKENNNSDVKAVNDGTYTIMGPFKINYGGKSVASIRVKNKKKDITGTDGGSIYFITGSYSTVDAVASNIASVKNEMSNKLTYTSSGKVSGIPANKNFYIVIKDTDSSLINNGDIKVTIKQENLKYYKARLVLVGQKDAKTQQVGIFAGKEMTAKGEITYTIDEDNIQKGFSLVINKKDDNNNKVRNAKFKIKVEDTGKWLAGSEGSYSYNNSFAKATTWTTDSNGKIEIKGLDKKYSYSVYEVEVPNGYLSLKYQIESGMKVNNTKLNSSRYSSTYGINCGKIQYTDSKASVEMNITNIKEFLKITINKKNDSNKVVTGAKFKVKVDNTGKWLAGSEGSYSYNNSFAKAKTWTTDRNGKIEIKGLNSSYKYSIYEIATPADYLALEHQIEAGITVNGKKLSSDKYSSTYGINCGSIQYKKSDPFVDMNIVNIEEYLKITINKKNELEKPISGAGFKVKVKETQKWLEGREGSYSYNNSFAKATTWTSNSKGMIEIAGINPDYTYLVYETNTPSGWLEIGRQIEAGMTVTAGGAKKPISYESYESKVVVKCAEIKYNRKNPFVEMDIVNIQEYLDISGMIWKDAVGAKTDDNDNVYNTLDNVDNISYTLDNNDGNFATGDKLYDKPVRITLWKYNEETKKYEQESVWDEKGNKVNTIETSNGNYKMETPITITDTMSKDQVAAKLKGYYLKLEYKSEYTDTNGNKISYYSTVAPGTSLNSSKAVPNINDKDEKDIFDPRPKEWVDTYIYNLSNYVNKDYEFQELKNMNMGLVRVVSAYDFDVNQVIEYVQVRINGYKYTYKYGENGKVEYKPSPTPTVQFDNGWAYTRPIYPSDIAYNKLHSGALEIYVVYRIDIQDLNPNGKEGIPANKQVAYIEKSLSDIKIKNQYDTYRYTLSDVDTTLDADLNPTIANNIKDDIKGWTGNGTAVYGKKIDLVGIKDIESVYIQFKINDEAINDVLNGATYETKPTKAFVTGKHEYNKTYYGWNKDHNSYELDIDTQTLKTKEQTKESDSIYLKLTLGTERQITGTVFEDNIVTTNGEELGNGQYDNGENKVESVKVDLLNQDYSLAEIYPKNTSGEYNKTTTGTTKIMSDSNGTYTIIGITPGKYYIRFTYGDGTYKIADYKSTIITDDKIKEAILAKTDSDKEANANWYKDVTDIVHSTAVDDLEQREKYNANNNSIDKIQANTGLMDISVENTKENSVAVTAEDVDYNPNDPKPYGVIEKIEGINFGIIKHPDVNIEVDKVVNNIKITNTQGNIIAEGNPVTQNIPYVSNLDVDKHIIDGTTYVKAEISEEELYGSTLELKYAITVKNSSAVNYYEELKGDGSDSDYHGYYYMFGDKSTPDSKEVTITIEKVNDYIDKSVQSDTLKVEGTKYIIDFEEGNGTKEGVEYDYIAAIKGWGELKTAKHKNPDGSNKYDENVTQETAEYTASRLLSAEDDDLFVSNVAEVETLKITNTPKLVETISKDSKYFDSTFTNPTKQVFVTVTPPTGEDTITPIIYIVTAAIAGITVVGGVILIKKKVLDK